MACLSVGPSLLRHDIPTNLDDVVGSHPHEVPIKCRVVQSAQRQPIVHAGHSFRLGVGGDMGRVEQFVTAEPTKRALVLVGFQNPLTEGLLVKPTTGLYRHILASQPGRLLSTPSERPM